MDRIACRAANLLVGNAERDAVLECALVGPAIDFSSETLIAICGGDLSARIDDVPIPTWRAVRAPSGSTLRFGPAVRGCRAYVAIAGGLDVPEVFGSRSTYLRGGFGGYQGRALRAGDAIRTGEASSLSRAIAASLAGLDDGATTKATIARWSYGVTARPPYGADIVVRLIDGAHASLLDARSRADLFDARFRISSSSDRMGYRLDGTALALQQPTELLSEGVTFGTVQLPPGGAPIILMADRQTTGGYPRIGEVASVDLPLVAQLKPGDTLRFRSISLADAQRLYLQQEQDIAQARAGIALRFHDKTGKT